VSDETTKGAAEKAAPTRYAQQRLEALWTRVEQLESAVEVAGAFLEQGKADFVTVTAPLALATLKATLQQTFQGALLCDRNTTDEHLDHWMPEIERHEAERGGNA